MSKLLGEQRKVFYLFRIGVIVGTVYEDVFVFTFLHPKNKTCHILIGKQHKLFNKLMRVFSDFRNYSQRFTFFIELKLYFSCLKVYSAFIKAFFAKFMCKIIQCF